MPRKQAPTVPHVPPPPPPAAQAASYRVLSSAVGQWQRGAIVTAADLGGSERAAVLLARGAVEEVTP